METVPEDRMINKLLREYESIMGKIAVLKPNETDNAQVATAKDYLKGLFKPIVIVIGEVIIDTDKVLVAPNALDKPPVPNFTHQLCDYLIDNIMRVFSLYIIQLGSDTDLS